MDSEKVSQIDQKTSTRLEACFLCVADLCDAYMDCRCNVDILTLTDRKSCVAQHFAEIQKVMDHLSSVCYKHVC